MGIGSHAHDFRNPAINQRSDHPWRDYRGEAHGLRQAVDSIYIQPYTKFTAKFLLLEVPVMLPRTDAPDIVIIGGGNAALCAAMTAAELGASVLMLEGAPKPYRG